MNEFGPLVKFLKKRHHKCYWFQIEKSPCDGSPYQLMYAIHWIGLTNPYSLRY